MLKQFFLKSVGRNFRQPGSGPLGFITKHMFFLRKNVPLLKATVELCKIKPHHNVLEIGFGGGVGLQTACEYVKDGSGHVSGIEISDAMLKHVNKSLLKEIKAGKLDVHLHDVVSPLPFPPNHFNTVFHTNCFYFWDDKVAAAKNILEVMKPGGVMVTALVPEFLQASKEKGFFDYNNANLDHVEYMDCLVKAGFENVESKDVEQGILKFIAIYGQKAAELQNPRGY